MNLTSKIIQILKYLRRGTAECALNTTSIAGNSINNHSQTTGGPPLMLPPRRHQLVRARAWRGTRPEANYLVDAVDLVLPGLSLKRRAIRLPVKRGLPDLLVGVELVGTLAVPAGTVGQLTSVSKT